MRPIAAAVLACLAGQPFAYADKGSEPTTMPTIVVNGGPVGGAAQGGSSESVGAQQLAETVNVMTAEDTIKYLPSMLVRKRYDGDTQAPLATRTTGINASARSLIFVDGVLLSALVNNNNANGSPRWFMVAPEEIESVDVLYGPYSAAYAGGSYGAVLKLNTRMPTRFEATVKLGVASQQFGDYATQAHYGTRNVNATLGSRGGALAWFLSANHLESNSQPLSLATLAQSGKLALAGDPVLTHAVQDVNRSGAAILVIGAGNLTHTVQDSAKLKLAIDLARGVTASYMLGYWQNSASTVAQSYLRAADGGAYYGGASGNVNIGGYAYAASAVGAQFASSASDQAHWMHSLGLQAKSGAQWDWDALATSYRYAKDLTRSSTGLYPAAQFGGTGRVADAGGTAWSTLDASGTWRAPGNGQQLRFGLHQDRYALVSPTYNSADWVAGQVGALFSDSRGSTRTRAWWLQDAWRLAPSWNLTLGLRAETWRADGGYNYALAASGKGFAVNQPAVDHAGYSPKASLRWAAGGQWLVTASMGKALRFPTVGELYQNVQTGATFTQANPFLKPENVRSGELALERLAADGRLRLSLFDERVGDALIAQTATLAGVAAPVSFTQNVDRTHQRGVELVGEQQNTGIDGLSVNGSLTYVDAHIVANSGYVATVAGATSVGKRTPYVPTWRATAQATYRPNDQWSFTLAGRYSGRLYATVDNTDVATHTYQGFDGYVVADLRAHYRIDRQWSAALGIDNLNRRNYYLFHPFPQRTLVADLKFSY